MVGIMSQIPKFGDASTSPAGDAGSLAGDVVASPNCGIFDIAERLIHNEELLNFVLSQKNLNKR